MTKYLIYFLVTIMAIGCKTQKVVQWPQTAEVLYISTSEGNIVLKSAGYGKNEVECILKAEQNAFDVLLFRGVPGSQQSIPIVSTSEKEKVAFKKYFEEFYSSKRYKSFITSIDNASGIQREKEYKKIWINIGINLNALKRDLEENNVIGKFGLK